MGLLVWYSVESESDTYPEWLEMELTESVMQWFMAIFLQI